MREKIFVIKLKEMPECCRNCPICADDKNGTYCARSDRYIDDIHKKPNWCPVEEIAINN